MGDSWRHGGETLEMEQPPRHRRHAPVRVRAPELWFPSLKSVSLLFSMLWVVSYAEKSPNIVFILIDDTGFNDLGYNNRSSTSPGRISTPNLDSLADGGVKLDSYYVQPPLPAFLPACLPCLPACLPASLI
jgi:hypothetical protein